MNPERRKLVKEILDEALKRDPAERPNYLDEVCRDDQRLRYEVEAALAFPEESARSKTTNRSPFPNGLVHTRYSRS